MSKQCPWCGFTQARLAIGEHGAQTLDCKENRHRMFLDSRGRVSAATIDDERRRGERADTQSAPRVNEHGSWSFKEVF